jgi:hypothetical protein
MRRLAVVGLVMWLSAIQLPAQSPSRWTPGRTPDGQPDLQGVWTNATITPLERPAALKDKAF